MSKAFTRESDDAPDTSLAGRPAAVLPEGTPNYLTPDGAEQLRRELERLASEVRPALQQSGDETQSSDLRRVDQRVREVSEILSSGTVVTPPERPWEQVAFGAIVTVRKRDGEEVTYRIVGLAEVNLDRGWVSWLTPVAKALMNARIGERVFLQLPGGQTELEVLDISYHEAQS